MNITELAMLKKMAGKGGNGTTVSLDKTLTKEGYAADAKAVGDALVKLYTGAEIYVVADFSDGTRVKSLAEYVTENVTDGQPVKLNITVVDALPATLVPLTDPTAPWNLYVVKSTGIAYIDIGEGAQTIGSAPLGFWRFADKGWTTEINAETEMGIYCVGTTNTSNASGGLSIKKIEFTDRPSAYAWLVENYLSVIRCVLRADIIANPMVFNSIEFVGGVAPVVRFANISIGFSGSGDASTIINNFVLFVVTNESIVATMNGASLIYNSDDTFDLVYDGASDIPDEYWSAANISLEIYYMG